MVSTIFLGSSNGHLLLEIVITSLYLPRNCIINGGPSSNTQTLLNKSLKILRPSSNIINTWNKKKRPKKLSPLKTRDSGPPLASLKKKYPQASAQELKKKMLMALTSQLDEINKDDIMSTSSKSQAPSNS